MALKSKAYLRRADRSDLDTMVSWMADPAFVHFIYGDPTRTTKQIRQYLVSLIGRQMAGTIPGHLHLIAERPGEAPLGMITIGGISWKNRTCSLDAYIIEKERNKMTGFTVACQGIDYAFRELNLRRLNIYIYAFNPRSWRLFEITGGKRELELKQHVARDGELLDMYGYGLLRSEWDAFKEKMGKRYEGMSLAAMIKNRREALRGATAKT
jgi:RimJ/RimL family protein N-acetyltransferase